MGSWATVVDILTAKAPNFSKIQKSSTMSGIWFGIRRSSADHYILGVQSIEHDNEGGSHQIAKKSVAGNCILFFSLDNIAFAAKRDSGVVLREWSAMGISSSHRNLS
jgi:hypothetical protein